MMCYSEWRIVKVPSLPRGAVVPIGQSPFPLIQGKGDSCWGNGKVEDNCPMSKANFGIRFTFQGHRVFYLAPVFSLSPFRHSLYSVMSYETRTRTIGAA